VARYLHTRMVRHCCVKCLGFVPNETKGQNKGMKTQKAIGTNRLKQSLQYATMWAPCAVPDFVTFDSPSDEIAQTFFVDTQSSGDKVFGRPCPKNPRHGFVESRVLNTWEEAVSLLEETLAADPDGEVMLISAIESKFSAVVSDRITVGINNDGATAGYGNPLEIYTNGVARSPWFDDVGIPEGNAAFLEFVYGRKNRYGSQTRTYAVQCRAGEHLPRKPDAIFEDMVITQILEPLPKENPEAMPEWERRMQSLPRDKTGIAVYVEEGSLSSHAAVQAIKHGVRAVFTTRKPKIGEAIVKNEEESVDLHNDIMRGMGYSTITSESDGYLFDIRAGLIIALMGAHNANYITKTPEGAFLFGVGVMTTIRAAATACFGEFRHWKRIARTDFANMAGRSRDSIFDRVRPWEITLLVTALRQAGKAFHSKGWNQSYGGKAWYNCYLATVDLAAATSEYQDSPTTANLAKVVGKLHILFNTCHNGGPVLTKFLDVTLFDYFAKGNVKANANAIAAIFVLLDRLDYFRPESHLRCEAVRKYWRVEQSLKYRVRLSWTYNSDKDKYDYAAVVYAKFGATIVKSYILWNNAALIAALHKMPNPSKGKIVKNKYGVLIFGNEIIGTVKGLFGE